MEDIGYHGNMGTWRNHAQVIAYQYCNGEVQFLLQYLLYEAYCMANIEHLITRLLNDDVILALAQPVMAS